MAADNARFIAGENYNPYFYANEFLRHLRSALGLAGRVHRGFDRERNTFNQGEIIKIRRPSDFAVEDVTAGTFNQLDPEYFQLSLDHHVQTSFSISDKDQAFAPGQVVEENFPRMAYRVVERIDTELQKSALMAPHVHVISVPGTPDVKDVTGPGAILDDLGVPDDGMRHMQVSAQLKEGFLKLPAFSQHQGAGETGVDTQRRGFIGQKYGFEVFMNQNHQSFVTPASYTGWTAAVNNAGGYAKHADTIVVDGGSADLTLPKGSVVQFGADTQRYALTADAVIGTGAGTLSVYPKLKAPVADNATVTLLAGSGGFAGVSYGSGGSLASSKTYEQNLAFHRNGLALAFARLPEHGDGLGARIGSIQSEDGISVRVRIFYDGTTTKVNAAIDVLFGTALLDANLVCRVLREVA